MPERPVHDLSEHEFIEFASANPSQVFMMYRDLALPMDVRGDVSANEVIARAGVPVAIPGSTPEADEALRDGLAVRGDPRKDDPTLIAYYAMATPGHPGAVEKSIALLTELIKARGEIELEKIMESQSPTLLFALCRKLTPALASAMADGFRKQLELQEQARQENILAMQRERERLHQNEVVQKLVEWFTRNGMDLPDTVDFGEMTNAAIEIVCAQPDLLSQSKRQIMKREVAEFELQTYAFEELYEATFLLLQSPSISNEQKQRLVNERMIADLRAARTQDEPYGLNALRFGALNEVVPEMHDSGTLQSYYEEADTVLREESDDRAISDSDLTPLLKLIAFGSQYQQIPDSMANSIARLFIAHKDNSPNNPQYIASIVDALGSYVLAQAADQESLEQAFAMVERLRVELPPGSKVHPVWYSRLLEKVMYTALKVQKDESRFAGVDFHSFRSAFFAQLEKYGPHLDRSSIEMIYHSSMPDMMPVKFHELLAERWITGGTYRVYEPGIAAELYSLHDDAKHTMITLFKHPYLPVEVKEKLFAGLRAQFPYTHDEAVALLETDDQYVQFALTHYLGDLTYVEALKQNIYRNGGATIEGGTIQTTINETRRAKVRV